MDLGVEGAGGGIERGREADDAAVEAAAGHRVELEVGGLAELEVLHVAFGGADEKTQCVDLIDGQDRAIVRAGADQRAGVEAALRDDAVERAGDAGLA